MTDIQTFERALPHGITLSCRAAGEPGRPLMLFLHGFPEAAFIWDPLLAHFARPENGGYRCVAPNLRGFERSSAPAEVEAYQAHRLMQDLCALADSEAAGGQIDTLVAHDWGGAFGWGMASAMPERVGRLVIINSPHAGTFARELKNSPEQQEASAYMNWLARPGSEEVLARDDFARLFGMLSSMQPGAGNADWLTEDVKAQYRDVWSQGLVGACNLYRVTPLKPGNDIPDIPRERVTVDIPTLVLWGMADIALRPGLLDGLEDYVPQLEIERLEGATHWVVHEQPELVMARIGAFIRRHPGLGG